MKMSFITKALVLLIATWLAFIMSQPLPIFMLFVGVALIFRGLVYRVA